MMHYLPSNVSTQSAPSAASRRASVRCDFWRDKGHLRGCNDNTPHPNHIAFLKELTNGFSDVKIDTTSPGLLFLESAYKDVLDAVSLHHNFCETRFELDQIVALDRVDAGFTFLVRVPGFPARSPTTVNWYCPPRELVNNDVQHHIRTLIESFVTNIVPIHVAALRERYVFAGVVAPAILVTPSLQTFPAPITPGTCYYEFTFDSLERSVSTPKLATKPKEVCVHANQVKYPSISVSRQDQLRPPHQPHWHDRLESLNPREKSSPTVQ
jgi:hypothetical protein